MSDIRKELKRSKILSALIMLVAGLVFLIFPNTSLAIAIRCVGAIAMIGGALKIFSFVRSGDRSSVLTVELILGILAVIVGLSLIANPGWPVQFLNVIAGLFLVVIGAANLINSVKYRSMSVGGLLDFVPYIITVVLGIILFSNPWGSTVVLVRIIGVFIIYEAVADIFAYTRYRE